MLIHTYLMVVPSSNGGPQVCEIGDWKNLPQASRENSSVSPFGAARLMGRLANFHARPLGDFPVSDFTDLRTTTFLAPCVTLLLELALQS